MPTPRRCSTSSATSRTRPKAPRATATRSADLPRLRPPQKRRPRELPQLRGGAGHDHRGRDQREPPAADHAYRPPTARSVRLDPGQSARIPGLAYVPMRGGIIEPITQPPRRAGDRPDCRMASTRWKTASDRAPEERKKSPPPGTRPSGGVFPFRRPAAAGSFGPSPPWRGRSGGSPPEWRHLRELWGAFPQFGATGLLDFNRAQKAACVPQPVDQQAVAVRRVPAVSLPLRDLARSRISEAEGGPSRLVVGVEPGRPAARLSRSTP